MPQPIIHSYRSLYCVNVIIFDLPITILYIDSNNDLFIINSLLNIY